MKSAARKGVITCLVTRLLIPAAALAMRGAGRHFFCMAPLFIHFTGEKKYNVLKEPAEIHFRRRAKGNLTIYVVIHDRRVRVFLSG